MKFIKAEQVEKGKLVITKKEFDKEIKEILDEIDNWFNRNNQYKDKKKYGYFMYDLKLEELKQIIKQKVGDLVE